MRGCLKPRPDVGLGFDPPRSDVLGLRHAKDVVAAVAPNIQRYIDGDVVARPASTGGSGS